MHEDVIFSHCNIIHDTPLHNNHKIMKNNYYMYTTKHKHMSCLVGKPTMWFPKRSDTNPPVQSQKRARILKFRI